MLRESFNVEIEGGRRLGSPRVIKNNEFEALREGAAWVRDPPSIFGFFLVLASAS